MIDIEVFHRVGKAKNRSVKVWIDGKCIYQNEIATAEELINWRNALHNELRWLNDYLREEGLEK
jgi:hypothetical protein